jgi:hypothetical protein
MKACSHARARAPRVLNGPLTGSGIFTRGTPFNNGPASMSQKDHSSLFSPTQENRSERRSKLRIQGPLPVRVRGVDEGGRPFDTVGVLDDLGVGGLRMRLECRVTSAARLFFIIQSPTPPGADAPGMRVAARGVARRIEPGASGSCGIGVQFERYRQTQRPCALRRARH